MNFDVLTLFPGMFHGPIQDGVLGRARRSGHFGVRIHDLRRWGIGPQRQVDDRPYGGGHGMILRPEPVFDAVEWIRERYPAQNDRVVLLCPQGRRLDHQAAERLAGHDRILLISGRYEGVDERIRRELADEELSIGDVVLTGGELPAMVVLDATARFVPGVLGSAEASATDSFADGLLESPYYTRPVEYRGARVPDVLLSGDHAAIERWRAEQARTTTRLKRPDLLEES